MLTDGPLVDGQMLSSFSIDQSLTTQSFAIALTDMNQPTVSVDGRIRVYHPNDQLGPLLVKYFHQLAVAIEEDMGTRLPFTLNVIYTTTQTSPTVTKYGVIHIGRSIYPVENSAIYSEELKDIQSAIARSIYEIYFSHVISPSWWRSQWVSMGLTNYFGGICPYLPFKAATEFSIELPQTVLRKNNIWKGDLMEYDFINNVDNINIPNVQATELRCKNEILIRQRPTINIYLNHFQQHMSCGQ